MDPHDLSCVARHHAAERVGDALRHVGAVRKER